MSKKDTLLIIKYKIMERIITINVGGKHFMTYQSTLLKYPTTVLGRMYSKDNELKVDEVQFFDRSSEIFDHILNFYRTGLPIYQLVQASFNKITIDVFPGFSSFKHDDI